MKLTADEIEDHLAWLRRAVQDPQVNARLVLEGILDVLEARTVQFAEIVAATDARLAELGDAVGAKDKK